MITEGYIPKTLLNFANKNSDVIEKVSRELDHTSTSYEFIITLKNGETIRDYTAKSLIKKFK